MGVLQHPAVTQPPTYAAVLDLLEGQYAEAEAEGRVLMRPELFCPPDAMPDVAQAYEWWPRECPEKLSWAFSFGGSLATHAAPHNTEPLLAHLGRVAARVAAWLVSEGRDPARANETAGERRTRKARESMARTRERRSAGTSPERQAALAYVKGLYDEYLDRCRERKGAYEALTSAVNHSKASWEEAKAALDAGDMDYFAGVVPGCGDGE